MDPGRGGGGTWAGVWSSILSSVAKNDDQVEIARGLDELMELAMY